jgi:hypothetical protein
VLLVFRGYEETMGITGTFRTIGAITGDRSGNQPTRQNRPITHRDGGNSVGRVTSAKGRGAKGYEPMPLNLMRLVWHNENTKSDFSHAGTGSTAARTPRTHWNDMKPQIHVVLM